MNCRIKYSFFVLLIFTGCYKSNLPAETPLAIRQEINKISAEPVRNPPASVWRYEYKGQVVYYIPAYCCDIPSKLMDAFGKIICSPDGGFSGQGDGKCPDFFSSKVAGVLIWQDSRK